VTDEREEVKEMRRHRIRLAAGLGAVFGAMAIAVPLVNAGSSSEQSARPGQSGEVALATNSSGSGGAVAAAPSANEQAAPAGLGVGDIQRASQGSGGEGDISAAPTAGVDEQPAP
jgi:hypothetical protein